jgi:monoamine oxidase
MRSKRSCVDVAIVGGGVSGLYAAWRLASSRSVSGEIAVFEASSRLGGKLWSHRFGVADEHPAELGAMFFGENHGLTRDLCVNALGLVADPVKPVPFLAHVNGRPFPIVEFGNDKLLQSGLDEAEKGLPYHGLLAQALRRIVPDLGELWPLGIRGRQETLAYLQTVTYKQKPLYQWGFAELLEDVLSANAIAALNGICGSNSVVENHNAYDMLVGFLYQFTSTWYQLKDGYQRLPDELALKATEAGVRILTERQLVAVERSPDGRRELSLRFQAESGSELVSAKGVILALPQGALHLILRESTTLGTSVFERLLDSISPAPARKLFLRFNSPWWNRSGEQEAAFSRTAYGYSRTDLPIRQCYFFGKEPSSGQELVLAMFTDGAASDHWVKLIKGNEGNVTHFKALPRQMVREAIRQLSILHNLAVPDPVDGVFVDWMQPPFHGGWHHWRTGYKSWELSQQAAGPAGNLNLYCCGDAFSPVMGWVEGALLSVEKVLQRQFGLQPPALCGTESGSVSA